MFEFIINLDHIPVKYTYMYIHTYINIYFNIRMCFGCALCKTETDCSIALLFFNQM